MLNFCALLESLFHDYNRHQIGALLSVKAPFLSMGGSSEIQITTEKQFDDFIAELREFLEKVGYYTTFVQAVGEK